MKILLSSHLEIRLKERKIPRNYPKKIISKPDAQYIDTRTGYNIAMRRMKYNYKLRPMVVVYDIIGLEAQVITIHPISHKEINNKLKRGRWKIYEKN